MYIVQCPPQSVQVVQLRTQVCVVFLLAADFSLPDHLVSPTVFYPLLSRQTRSLTANKTILRPGKIL